jgi:hypothetical protein
VAVTAAASTAQVTSGALVVHVGVTAIDLSS